MKSLNETEIRYVRRLLEITAGHTGVSSSAGKQLDKYAAVESWSSIGKRVKEYFDSLSPDSFKKLMMMASERRLKFVMQNVGLDVRNDMHFDAADEEIKKQIMHRKKTMRTEARQHSTSYDMDMHKNVIQTNSEVNNPGEMTYDEAVSYLSGLKETDRLMNDMYISAGPEADDRIEYDEEIYAGYTAEQALIVLGAAPGGPHTADPRVDHDAVRRDEEDAAAEEAAWDDPWHRNGPAWARQYDQDGIDILDMMVDDPKADVKTIDGQDADDWMNETNYDLYVEIPVNIRRPDGKPFDADDVENIKALVNKRSREIRQYSPGIHLTVRTQVGETSADTEFEFH